MRPLVLVLGLAGLGGFSYSSWSSMHEGIAENLTARAQAALSQSDLDGVSVEFDHMDGLVSGAETPEAQARAKEVILAAIPTGRVLFPQTANEIDAFQSNDESIDETTADSHEEETNSALAANHDDPIVEQAGYDDSQPDLNNREPAAVDAGAVAETEEVSTPPVVTESEEVVSPESVAVANDAASPDNVEDKEVSESANGEIRPGEELGTQVVPNEQDVEGQVPPSTSAPQSDEVVTLDEVPVPNVVEEDVQVASTSEVQESQDVAVVAETVEEAVEEEAATEEAPGEEVVVVESTSTKRGSDTENVTADAQKDESAKASDKVVADSSGAKENSPSAATSKGDNVASTGKDAAGESAENQSQSQKGSPKVEGQVTVPWFGVCVNSKDGEAVLRSPNQGSAFAAAGIVQGDAILKCNDRRIYNVEDLLEEMRGHVAGDEVRVIIRRRGELRKGIVVLKKNKPSTNAANSASES